MGRVRGRLGLRGRVHRMVAVSDPQKSAELGSSPPVFRHHVPSGSDGMLHDTRLLFVCVLKH